MDSARRVAITTLTDGAPGSRADYVAHEEPLEIQIQGVPCAVVMRTPGHDEDLVRGFLLSERIVESINDIMSLRHCSSVSDPEADENVMRAVLSPELPLAIEKLRRNLYASSSCGICGKATIEAALAHGSPVAHTLRIESAALYLIPERLRLEQAAFDQTGGLHAAALFDTGAALTGVREDVGRHNAVDKTIGALLGDRAAGSGKGLAVSGRISLEIVQKAAAVGLEMVVGISAPTSLAVRFAEALGVTVVGFVRGKSANVYTHPGRIAEA